MTCISTLVLSGLTGVAAAQTSPSTSTPAPAPSTSPTTTVPPWDATPKDPSNPIPPPPPASATKAGGFDEKVSKLVEAETTPTKRVYDNPDGSRTAKIHLTPQRFKDSAGKWVDYDLNLVTRPDGNLGAKAAPQAATLNKRADGNVATVATSAGPVSLRHPSVSPAVAALDKREAKYPGALSGGRDLKIALTPDGFEESVVLPDAKAPASYTNELVLPAGVTVRQADQGVELVDKAGKTIASFGGGFAYDAEFSRGALPAPVSVRLVSQKANVATLEVAIADQSWLGAPGRTFPVTIDPTFAQLGSAPGSGGIATTVIDGTAANTAYYGSMSLGAGLYNSGHTYRTLLRFDLSSLPADAVVTYAQLAVYNVYTGFTYSCAGKAVDVRGLAGPFSAATTWNTKPGVVAGDPSTSPAFAHQPWPNGGGNYCPPDYAGLPVTSIVQGWRNGVANHGVELRSNGSDMASFQHFWSAHAGSGQYQPYLQLIWDRVPNPPTNVVATANADGTATVNWTLSTVPANSSAVDAYVVHALNPGILSYADDTAIVCATCTSAPLTKLTPSRTYVFGVYPHNGAGYGFAASNQITTAPGNLTTPLAIGPTHGLSVKTNGTVAAWGKNTYGQLGDDTLNDKHNQGGQVLNIGPPGASAVSVAAGDGFSIALLADGTVKAWGRNDLGQLGDGWANDTVEQQWVKKPVDVIATEGTVAIAAGCTHALALGADGNVWGWGDNSSGQLGLAGGGLSPVRVHVPGINSINSIAAGCGWSMARDSSGRVWTWGLNSSGQLGDGTITSRHTPALVPNVSGAASIAAGHSHALVVTSSGTVRSWGANGSGQLGNNVSVGISTVAVNVANQAGTANLAGVTSVAAGNAHSVANTSSGVLAWGAAEHFQLGNASTAPKSLPVPVQVNGTSVPLTGVMAVAAGGNSTGAVTSGGQVKQAGSHFDSQNCETALDIPGTGPTTLPVPGPRPTSRAPNPACDNQAPTPPASYGPLDTLNRATSATRTLNSTSLRSSQGRSNPNFDPVGFESGNDQNRSHLLAYIFGGTTLISENAQTNIVALLRGANQYPNGMRLYEAAVAKRLVTECKPIAYSVTAQYPPSCSGGISCAPRSVTIDANDFVGYHLVCEVVNVSNPPPCSLPG